MTEPTSPQMNREAQFIQHPYKGTPGISYERRSQGGPADQFDVDCLLHRGDDGLLLGILYHYPTENPWEKAGNILVGVHPEHRRKGIATALLDRARRMWALSGKQQRYTGEGWAFATSYLERSTRGQA